jgi:two-component system LytT family response regulator
MEAFTRVQELARRSSTRIAIKVKGSILFIDPGDVVAVLAEGNYVVLQQESNSYLMRESISVMAEKLEPFGFIRIHRSAIVNAAFVEEIKPYPTGEYGLRVKGGKEYTVTRTYKENLKSLAELWIGTGGFFLDRQRRLSGRSNRKPPAACAREETSPLRSSNGHAREIHNH